MGGIIIYTRGQFALIGKVSVKALRVYDEMGLLKPVYIDPNNQYKYYSTEQVDEIILINELKTFGFPLEEIKDLQEKKSPEYLKERLIKRLSQLDREIRESCRVKNDLTKKISFLSSGIAQAERRQYEIQIIRMEDMVAVSYREKANIQDAGRLIGKVYEMIYEFSLEAVDSHLIVFHNSENDILYEEENWDMEVCVPVNKAIQSENFSTKILKGKTYAKTSHIGAFNETGKAHAAIIDWIETNSFKVCGAPMEKYLTTRQAVFNPSSFEVEVCYPVEIS